MNKFGWSLPPGVSNRDIDPPDPPCEMCGKADSDCICPECPTCHAVGDPFCYRDHGLKQNIDQQIGCVELDIRQRQDALADSQSYLEFLKARKQEAASPAPNQPDESEL